MIRLNSNKISQSRQIISDNSTLEYTPADCEDKHHFDLFQL